MKMLTFCPAVSLLGVSASGEVGTVSRGASSVAITGVSDSGTIDTVADAESYDLGGVSASGSVGTVGTGPRSFALTGNYAAGDVGVVVAVYWKLIDDMQDANWTEIVT